MDETQQQQDPLNGFLADGLVMQIERMEELAALLETRYQGDRATRDILLQLTHEIKGIIYKYIVGI